MMNSDHNLVEQRLKTFNITNSLENSEIEAYLQGQKYHQRLLLQISLDDQTKIALIGKCLAKLNHLNGLHLVFITNSLQKDNSLEDILIALKSFQNLTDFKFDLNNQSAVINYQEMLIQLAIILNTMSQLEKLSINIPCYDCKENEQIQKIFQNLKCLKELRFRVSINQKNLQNSLQSLQEVLTQINQLNHLTSLDLEIDYPVNCQKFNKYIWLFDNLNNLIELSIKSRSTKQQMISLSEQLRNMHSLSRLNIYIQLCEQTQDSQLFDTVFNLKSLEEFILSIDGGFYDISLSIGDNVCAESPLKVLNIQVQKSISKSRGKIVFGKQIMNIKHLEKLFFRFDFCEITKESYEVLLFWKDEWKKLLEFSFESYYLANRIAIIQFLRDSFFSVKSVKKFRTNLQFNNTTGKNDFLKGLVQLNNLESLTISNLCEEYNEKIEQQYLECFQNLTCLKQLRLEYISSEREIICLGQSFQFMTGLVLLKLYFKNIQLFQDFKIFCDNLQLLQNLKQLQITWNYMFGNNEKLMNKENTEILLKSIQTLKHLNILVLSLNIQNESKEVYSKEMCNIMKLLCKLNTLKLMPNIEFPLKNKIIKNSLRLVCLQNGSYDQL